MATPNPTKITAYWEVDTDKDPKIQAFEVEGQHLLFGAIASKFVRLNKLPESQELHFYLKGATDEKWPEPYQMYCSNLRHSACRLKSSSYTVCVRSKGAPSPDVTPPGELAKKIGKSPARGYEGKIERAFVLDYRNKLDALGRLKDYIDQCLNQWNQQQDANDQGSATAAKRFHSPQFTLVQSSGHGKSRLLHEIKEHYLVFYICVKRQIGGFPPQTTAIAEPLLETTNNRNWYELFYVHCLKLALDLFHDCEKSNLGRDEMIRRWNDEQEVRLDRLEWTLTEPEFLKLLSKEQADDIVKEFNALSLKHQLPVVIAMDEARALLTHEDFQNTQYRKVQAGLIRETHSFRNLMVIFADTTPRIANFTPADDHSLRQTGESVFFRPFIKVATFDCFVPAARQDQPLTLEEFKKREPAELYYYGRPLWGSMLEAAHQIVDEDILERNMNREKSGGGGGDAEYDEKYKREYLGHHEYRLLCLAVHKLLGGACDAFPQISSETKREAAALALLSCRVGFTFDQTSDLIVDMVAGYMATCLYVHEDRRRLYITYPSEPILASAASSIMRGPNAVLLIMQTIQKLISRQDLGIEREFVVRLLMCLGWDKCSGNRNSLYPRSMGEYLRCLLGEAFFKKTELPPIIMDGQLLLSHFIPVYGMLDEEVMEKLVERGAGATTEPGTRRVDLTIPFFLADGRLSALRVQVKNSPSNAQWTKGPEVTPPFVYRGGEDVDDRPYIGLYLQLTNPPRPAELVSWKGKSKHNYHISMGGLKTLGDNIGLTEEEIKVMEQILPSRFDPFSMNEDDAGFYDRTLPMTYMQLVSEKDNGSKKDNSKAERMEDSAVRKRTRKAVQHGVRR